MRPDDGVESQEVGILDLNLPTKKETRENVRAEIDTGKLNDLGPIVGNNKEAPESIPKEIMKSKIKSHLKVQPMMK